MASQLHRVPEAAQALNVTVKCIHNWVSQRKIGAVRLGRTIRIPQDEIDRIIKDGFTPARRIA